MANAYLTSVKQLAVYNNLNVLKVSCVFSGTWRIQTWKPITVKLPWGPQAHNSTGELVSALNIKYELLIDFFCLFYTNWKYYQQEWWLTIQAAWKRETFAFKFWWWESRKVSTNFSDCWTMQIIGTYMLFTIRFSMILGNHRPQLSAICTQLLITPLIIDFSSTANSWLTSEKRPGKSWGMVNRDKLYIKLHISLFYGERI